jgi:hypothetical protein
MRDIESIVSSFMKITPHRNHWSNWLCEHHNQPIDYKWDLRFPSYNLDKENAIRQYCVDYYKQVKRIRNVFEFDCNNLSDPRQIRDLMDFLLVENPKITPTHRNAYDKRRNYSI